MQEQSPASNDAPMPPMVRVVLYLPEQTVASIDKAARKRGGLSRSEIGRRWLEEGAAKEEGRR